MILLGYCKACKGRVSQEAASCPHCGQPEPFQPVPEQVQLLVSAGRTIDAIKQVRALMGLDLKDAKDFVDALAASLRRGA